jgi:hypothetical protein
MACVLIFKYGSFGPEFSLLKGDVFSALPPSELVTSLVSIIKLPLSDFNSSSSVNKDSCYYFLVLLDLVASSNLIFSIFSANGLPKNISL